MKRPPLKTRDELDQNQVIADFVKLAEHNRTMVTPPFSAESLAKLDYLSFLWLKFLQEHQLSTREFVNSVEDTNSVVVKVKDLTNEGFEFWRNAERFLSGRDFNVDPHNRVKRILVKELQKLRS